MERAAELAPHEGRPSTVVDLLDYVFFISDDQDVLSGQPVVVAIRVNRENTRDVVPMAPQWRFTAAGGLRHVALPDGKGATEPVATVIRQGNVPLQQLINVMDQAMSDSGWVKADGHWGAQEGADLMYCRLMPDGYVFQVQVPTVNLAAAAISETHKATNRQVDAYLRMLKAYVPLHSLISGILTEEAPRNWPQVIYHQTDSLLKLGDIADDAPVASVEAVMNSIRLFIKTHFQLDEFEVLVDQVGDKRELTITLSAGTDNEVEGSSASGEDTNHPDTSDRAWQRGVLPANGGATQSVPQASAPDAEDVGGEH